jgi:hypothetical protein
VKQHARSGGSGNIVRLWTPSGGLGMGDGVAEFLQSTDIAVLWHTVKDIPR